MASYTPRYFTLAELCASETAKKKKIDNFPSFDVTGHLLELTEALLDPLRVAWGSGLRIESGYRCPTLNKAVGGAATSAHLTGYAADVKPTNGRINELITFTRQWLQTTGRRFDQLIDERGKDGGHWLHIGLYGPNGVQRGQFLTMTKK